MAKTSKDITVILAEASELQTRHELEAYLDRECGTDTAIREEVESLLQHKDTLGDFLETTAHELDITTDSLSVMEGPGTVIGRYLLTNKIGEGGMAVVYMAKQERPIQRMIALKIIKLGMDTKQVITRFETERQTLAVLDHPNIAKVLDAGSTDTGRPYFVMDLVNGIPITDYCDKNKLGTRERLNLFLQVCQAIQHAHQKGIIHRDIKPSNILVTFHESSPLPKVIDFGIAKATQEQLTEKAVQTNVQTLVGTPAYMSPEQAQTGECDIDTRTDIYSLGVVLYELLTGKTPFNAQHLLKTGLDHYRHVIGKKEPERPSIRVARLKQSKAKVLGRGHQTTSIRLIRHLRIDLDWIVMKCLEKDRKRRYETVSGLDMDIQRYLRGEAVFARAPSAPYRTWKFVRRYKAVVVAGLVLLVAAVVSTWQAVRATRAEQEQKRLHSVAQAAQINEAHQRRQAEKEALGALRQAYNSDMNLTQQALATQNYGRMVQLLDRHRPQPDRPDLRQWEWRYFWNQARSEATFSLPPHPDAVMGMEMGPRGHYLVSSDRQGTVRLWDLKQRSLVTILSKSEFFPHRAVFSRDGTHLALVANDREGGARVKVLTIPARETASEFTHNRSIRALTFAPGGTGLLALDQSLTIYTGTLGEQTLQPRYPDRKAQEWRGRLARFSPDGSTIALVDRDGPIRLLDLSTGREKARIDVFEGGIGALAFAPDGKRLAVSPFFSESSTDIKVFSVESGREEKTLSGHISWIPSLAFTPDGERIVSAGADQTIRIWRLSDGRESTRLHGHLSEIYCITMSPDGKRLVSGCKDGTLFGWDLETIQHQASFETLSKEVRNLDFFADRGILSVNSDGTVSLWDADTLKEKETLSALGNEVHQCLMSEDRDRLIASTSRGELKVLDWNSRLVVKDSVWDPNHRAPINLIGFVDQGDTLVVMEPDARIRLFDTQTWEAKAVWEPPRARQWYAPTPILSPNERFLIYMGFNETINIVDFPNYTTETVPTQQNWSVLDMAFSPDSRLFVTSSGEGMVTLWDCTRREIVNVLQGHLLGVHAVTFSPDGQRLVSGSKGREAVKLWDMNTLHEVATLSGEGFISRHLQFAPDGNLLGAVNMKGVAHIWRAPSLEEIAEKEAADAITSDTPLGEENAKSI